jgi:hypothetical protein
VEEDEVEGRRGGKIFGTPQYITISVKNEAIKRYLCM